MLNRYAIVLLLSALTLPAYGQGFLLNPYAFGAVGIPTDNVALYTCENAGDLGEDTKGSNELTNTSVIQDVSIFKIGAASCHFDATTDDLAHATAFDYTGTQSFTFTGWVRIPSDPGATGIVLGIGSNQFSAGSYQYSFHYRELAEGDQWRFRTSDNVVEAFADDTNELDATFQFFAVMFDGSTGETCLRIDAGALVCATGVASISSEVQTFKMGENSGGTSGLVMHLDQIRVYERRLTSTELDAIHNE